MTDHAELVKLLLRRAERYPRAEGNDPPLTSTLREAAAAISALSRERDEADARHSSNIAQLLVALEPFAMISGEGDDDFADDTEVVVKFGRTTHYALRLVDLRRAQHVNDAVWESLSRAAPEGETPSPPREGIDE